MNQLEYRSPNTKPTVIGPLAWLCLATSGLAWGIIYASFHLQTNEFWIWTTIILCVLSLIIGITSIAMDIVRRRPAGSFAIAVVGILMAMAPLAFVLGLWWELAHGGHFGPG